MNKRNQCKKLIRKLNTRLLFISLYDNKVDFNGYYDNNFKLYFKDVFFTPLSFLQYQRPSLLFGLNNDRYRTDFIQNLEEYKILNDFIKNKYKTKSDKLSCILTNYCKFTIYYIANFIKQFNDWKKLGADTLFNFVKDFVNDNEDLENDEIKEIAIKRYIEFLITVAITPEFSKILLNDLCNKNITSVIRYVIPNMSTDKSFTINSNFAISNSNEIPYNKGLLNLTKQKEYGIIELTVKTPYSYKLEDIHNQAFISFFNRIFAAFKYQEVSFNALLLLIPTPIKITKETFYLKTFQTLISSEISTSELYFLSRYRDINESENVIVKNTDKNRLKNLSKLLQPISDFNVSRKNYQFILVALKFFKDAMNKDNKSERMSYCVQALEAIYNTNSSQLTRTISQRLAMVFSLLKEVKPRKYSSINPLDVQKQISKAYDIRSKYVHGAINSKIPDELLNQVIFYTQISIIITLAILSIQKDKINKDNLNSDYDNCLISKRYLQIYKNIFTGIKKYL